MTEDKDLLAKISQLAGMFLIGQPVFLTLCSLYPGQINQHKNHAASSTRGGRGSGHYSPQPVHPRGHTGWAPYRSRGGGRQPRRLVGPHRNRTLVLNNAAATSETNSGAQSGDASNDDTSETNQGGQNGGWVAKRDRHMQLINSAIFDKEAQARTKAIEESRKQKVERRTQKEEAKVMRHAQGVARHYAPSTQDNSYQITIQGVPFQVAKGGSKLLRLSSETIPYTPNDNGFGTGLRFSGDPFNANNTPKKMNVGGVNFVRSKTGNLHRLGAVVSKRYVAVLHILRIWLAFLSFFWADIRIIW